MTWIMTKEERIQKNKEFSRLSNMIEPYWDSKTRDLRKDTPKEIKDAFNPELEDVKILFLYKITYIGLQ